MINWPKYKVSTNNKWGATLKQTFIFDKCHWWKSRSLTPGAFISDKFVPWSSHRPRPELDLLQVWLHPDLGSLFCSWIPSQGFPPDEGDLHQRQPPTDQGAFVVEFFLHIFVNINVKIGIGAYLRCNPPSSRQRWSPPMTNPHGPIWYCQPSFININIIKNVYKLS